MRRLSALALSLPLVVACTKKEQPAPAEKASPPSSATAAESALPNAAPTAVLDEVGAKKPGEGVVVTYAGGWTVGNSAYVGFSLEGTKDEELPVSCMLSFQATTPAGIAGRLDDQKSKCDGMLPPKGRLATALKYDFDEAPSELRVRAEGAWFRVRLPAKDAGK